MSTYWVKQKIQEYDTVEAIQDVDAVTLKLAIKGSKGTKEHIVYKAGKADYVLNVENIQEAIEKNATVVVYDAWGEVTQAAKNLAKENKIRIFHFGVFDKLVKDGVL